MTGYEIIILAAGLVFFIASFFLKGKSGATETVDVNAEIRKIKEAAVLHEKEVQDRVRSYVENECETAVADVQDRLSKISNDKIIAIDEYASQVLERIENNNQAVVFLYDMLQKKDDEMKSTMNKMEQTRRENRELFNRLEELKQAKARVSSRNAAKAGANPAARPVENMAGMSPLAEREENRGKGSVPTTEFERQTAMHGEKLYGTKEQLGHTQAGPLSEAIALRQEAEKEGLPEPDHLIASQEESRRKHILALYQEHKSVKEISKLLSMGQGEVKLIIDLYADKGE